jgi:hypothetical protein
VDAYTSYIMRISEARTGELRREAADYALSRAARAGSDRGRIRFRTRLRRASAPVAVPVVSLRGRRTVDEARELSRSA